MKQHQADVLRFASIAASLYEGYGLRDTDNSMQRLIQDLEVYNDDQLFERNVRKLEEICIAIYNTVLRKMPTRYRRIFPYGIKQKYRPCDFEPLQIKRWQLFLEMKALLPSLLISVDIRYLKDESVQFISPLILSHTYNQKDEN